MAKKSRVIIRPSPHNLVGALAGALALEANLGLHIRNPLDNNLQRRLLVELRGKTVLGETQGRVDAGVKLLQFPATF